MNYCPVTLAINLSDYARHVLDRSVRRFERLNNVPVCVLTEHDFKSDGLTDPHFAKAYLWDKLPAAVDHLLYFDSDVMPLQKLPELPDIQFGAVTDVQTGIDSAHKVWPQLKSHGPYFNSGLVLARRDSRHVFDQLKVFQTATRDQRGCYDQSVFNLVAHSSLAVHILPKEWNYMFVIEPECKTDIYMLHFAGVVSKASFMSTFLNIVERYEDRAQALITTFSRAQ